MQIFKHENMQICRYADMQICRYANMQICSYSNIQCKQSTMHSQVEHVSESEIGKG